MPPKRKVEESESDSEEERLKEICGGLPYYLDVEEGVEQLKETDEWGSFLLGKDVISMDEDLYARMALRMEQGKKNESEKRRKKNDEIEARLDDVALPVPLVKWIHYDDYFNYVDRWWEIKAANGKYITHRDLLLDSPWEGPIKKMFYPHSYFEGWSYLGIDKRDGKPAIFGNFGN
jgi:hypothetical protein